MLYETSNISTSFFFKKKKKQKKKKLSSAYLHCSVEWDYKFDSLHYAISPRSCLGIPSVLYCLELPDLVCVYIS